MSWDPVTVVLLVVVGLLLADLLLAGGAMSMTAGTMMVGLIAHPIGWAVIIIVVLLLAVHPW